MPAHLPTVEDVKLALREHRLTPAAHLVALTLAQRAEEAVDPKAIADACALSPRTVKRSLEALEEAGLYLSAEAVAEEADAERFAGPALVADVLGLDGKPLPPGPGLEEAAG